jgi:superfamily I DNA/RNA helicase
MLPCHACEPGCPWYADPKDRADEMRAWQANHEFLGELEPTPEQDKKPVIRLDPDQQAAVEHVEGPALCTAGAGSGKTRVLTERISRLIYLGHAKPEEVLAVTFSRKATHELRERVAGRLGDDVAKRVQVSTFHSLGLAICREFAPHIGRSKMLSVWDEKACNAEMNAAWTEVLESKEAEDRVSLEEIHDHPVRHMLKVLDKHKRKPDDVEDIMEALTPLREHRFAFLNAILQYEETKRSCDALDYDDLIWVTTRLLISNDEVRSALQDRYRFVLVDEYQDTSRIQALMMRQIAGRHRNIFVVGDDDQAIYRWRGAEPTNLLDFEADWPGAKIYPLGRNYRSTPNIVDWAARSIAKNVKRRGKRIWSEADPGIDVRVEIADDVRAEADLAITSLVEHLDEDGMTLDDGAILVRTRRQLLTLSASAGRLNVPMRVVGTVPWYERADTRLVLSWLRMVCNPKDLNATTNALKSWPGIGPKTVACWRREASVCSGSLFEVPFRVAIEEARQKRTKQALQNFLDALREIENLARDHVGFAVNELYHRTGMHAEIEAEQNSEDPLVCEAARERDEIRYAFIVFCDRQEKRGLSGVQAVVDEVLTLSRQSKPEDGRGQLTASTIHASKGLEWHAVVVAGVCEEILPFMRSPAMTDDDDDEQEQAMGVEDERRLYYVACTRAKRRLILTYPKVKQSGSEFKPTVPSMFLNESDPNPKASKKWKRE